MPESRPHVTIIGAGVAGMSAALRLLEAGCPVTVIEKTNRPRRSVRSGTTGPRATTSTPSTSSRIGVRISSSCVRTSDSGGHRYPGPGEVAFVARPAFLTLTPLDGQTSRVLKGRAAADFKRLEYLGAQQYFWKNANAGVAHWSDMLLYEYSILDLLSDDSLDDDRDLEGVPQPGQRERIHALEIIRLGRRRPAPPGAPAEGLRGAELPYVRALLPDLPAPHRRVPSRPAVSAPTLPICPRASGL